MSKELFFIHVHIPKCGGSTFQDILKRNASVPKAFYREAPIVMHQHKSIDIELMIKRASYLEVFSSHHVNLDLPFHMTDPKVVAFTHVRNPVDRFVSHFFYEKRQANKPEALHFDLKFKEMSFEEYIDYCLENKNEYKHIKDQVGWLTGLDNDDGVNRVRKLVDAGQLYLFPLDRFDESCVLLENIYPAYFKNCAYVKMNVDQQKHELSNNTITKIKQITSPLDEKLMEIANNQVDKLEHEVFSKNISLNEALNDFYIRCSLFEKEFKKVKKKQKILGRINRVSRSVLGLK
jgi:hypothetical protein